MKDHTLIIVGGGVLLWMMMRRQQAAQFAPAAPRSMPGNVGTGWQQTASGAIAGFLQQLAKAPANATSQTVFPNYTVQDNGAVQDVVPQDMSLADYMNDYQSMLA